MGLSQEQLSEILEISPNHLSVIETGGKFVTSKQISQIIKEELENAQICITSKIEKLFRG